MEVIKVLQQSKYFRKTNYLIEAKYKLSVLQTFIFTQAYMNLADENMTDSSYKLYFKDIIENFSLSPKGDTYEKIVEAARGQGRRHARKIQILTGQPRAHGRIRHRFEDGKVTTALLISGR